jgi:small subunit ribosomal protein S6e
MVFKINIAQKDGKTYHLESDSEEFVGKELHSKIEGKDFSGDLSGYEFEIAGASDTAGFTSLENVEGAGLRRVLLSYGKGMHRRPRREGKKKVSNFKPKGLRMRKTVRGKVLSQDIVQINLKITKEGDKKLSEIFPDQNQPKPEPEWKKAKEQPVEEKAE